MVKNQIRFDWAIKRLLRNKANFKILEGFLTELLKERIEIEEILESESNQRNPMDKYNKVDLLAKNSKSELIIIEVQNEQELDYFHRMAYATSKSIAENIEIGNQYIKIKKIYSINIVYFDIGQGNDYIYHGKNEFQGVHKKDVLMLSKKQKESFKKKEPFEIFPEYYLIKVNQFDDIATDKIDEWIYYLKNNEIKDHFTAQGIDGARKLWKYDRLNDKDKKNYVKSLEDLAYARSMEWNRKKIKELEIKEAREIGKEEGHKEGHREGEKKGKIEIAKNLKALGYDTHKIKEITNLEIEDIEELD
jgi:predicted transposase/invertase (TIGR01784 family)